MRTHRMHIAGEPRSPRSLRLRGTFGRRGRRITAAAIVLAVGMLLIPSLAAPAGAATAGTARSQTASAPAAKTRSLTVQPHAAAGTTCLTGESNSYEFYTWCQGTSPAAYRTVAYCANGEAVLGVEYADGSGKLSYADCNATGGMGSTLNAAAGWGILECSNYNGTGTYAGYIDTQGDISGIMLNWGNGNITNGANTMCDYSIGQAAAINPNTAP